MFLQVFLRDVLQHLKCALQRLQKASLHAI